MAYRTKKIKAEDIRPGMEIECPKQRIGKERFTVKRITLGKERVAIFGEDGINQIVDKNTEYDRILSPAEEGEEAAREEAEARKEAEEEIKLEARKADIEEKIENLDLDIAEHATSILDEFEGITNNLHELQDGMTTAQEMDNDDTEFFKTVVETIGEALNHAQGMAKDFEEMKEERGNLARVNDFLEEKDIDQETQEIIDIEEELGNEPEK